MNITIFGTGYVGLVTGACLAEAGNTIVCMDVDKAKIDGLNNGKIPIYEPGLETMVLSNAAAGRLIFTDDVSRAVAHGRFQFIAVGTPPDEDGSADLQYVIAVASQIGRHMDGPRIIINKSTVPVGTADRVSKAIAGQLRARDVDITFDVVSNPEFLKEGAAIEDCQKPDRIIIGTESVQVLEQMKQLYAPFNRNHDKIIGMDIRSAELTKYAANAMLATKISFMNEMANVAERVGADIEQVRLGIGSDPRIGFSFIYPGCGYGGSCFPKDVQALVRTADDYDYRTEILRSVETVNQAQKQVLLERIRQHFDNQLEGRTLAVWGLSFKPNTDDMREASSRVLIEGLWAAGARVQAYDPEAAEEARRIWGDRDDLTLCDTAYDAVKGADGLAVVTEWRSFWSPDFDRLASELSDKVIFDGRNIYDPERLAAAGFTYYGIGRGSSIAQAAPEEFN